MPSAAEKHFLLRRLHSLSGLIPIGVFLCEHLFTNSFSWRPENYDFVVGTLILGLSPVVFHSAEIGVLLIPIAFHVILGIVITRQGSMNQLQYSYPKNWAYFAQRATGIVTLLFLLYHVSMMRILHHGIPHELITEKVTANALFRANPHLATKAHLVAPGFEGLNLLIYSTGVTAACFHFGNGLWTFMITWGVVIGRKAQKIAHVLCLLGAFSLMGLGFYGLTPYFSQWLGFDGFLREPPAALQSWVQVDPQALADPTDIKNWKVPSTTPSGS